MCVRHSVEQVKWLQGWASMCAVCMPGTTQGGGGGLTFVHPLRDTLLVADGAGIEGVDCSIPVQVPTPAHGKQDRAGGWEGWRHPCVKTWTCVLTPASRPPQLLQGAWPIAVEVMCGCWCCCKCQCSCLSAACLLLLVVLVRLLHVPLLCQAAATQVLLLPLLGGVQVCVVKVVLAGGWGSPLT